jgi:hypothetical protein
MSNHAGYWLVMTGDGDHVPLLGSLYQGWEGILALCDAHGRFHDNTCSLLAVKVKVNSARGFEN